MAKSDDIPGLEGLSVSSRSRVEAALKEAIERETVAGGLAGGAASSNIFSRGWIFSRLTPTLTDMEAIKGLPGVAQLGPEAFADFAGRLAKLKAETDLKR